MERAHARVTDPDTSKAAAAAINPEVQQGRVIHVARTVLGDFTQEEMSTYLRDTGSRTRTAINELETKGVVAKTGEKRMTRKGRKANVYALTEEAEK